MMVKDSIRRGEADCGSPASICDFGGSRLRIYVLYTTIEGTLAAVNTAAQHARDLGAGLTIVVADVVPFRYPVEAAPVSASFYETLCRALIEESRLEKNTCEIEVYFCRDQAACIEQVLKPKSLVVLGATKSWRNRHERRLEKALKQKGFDTVFVLAEGRSLIPSVDRIVHRMAVEDGARAHLCEHSGRFDLH